MTTEERATAAAKKALERFSDLPLTDAQKRRLIIWFEEWLLWDTPGDRAKAIETALLGEEK